jgi:hypothetical protein
LQLALLHLFLATRFTICSCGRPLIAFEFTLTTYDHFMHLVRRIKPKVPKGDKDEGYPELPLLNTPFKSIIRETAPFQLPKQWRAHDSSFEKDRKEL